MYTATPLYISTKRKKYCFKILLLSRKSRIRLPLQFDFACWIMQHSPGVMEGPGTQLFDHIAKCLADFVHENHLQEETSRSAQSEIMRSRLSYRKMIFLHSSWIWQCKNVTLLLRYYSQSSLFKFKNYYDCKCMVSIDRSYYKDTKTRTPKTIWIHLKLDLGRNDIVYFRTT